MNLNQVTVPCLDLATSVAFYKTLGLHLIVLADDRYARFECPDGDSTFSLHRADVIGSGPGVVIYFECADLDASVAKLQKRGILFDEPPTDKPWLWREARLSDPDGNRIILYFAGNNRKYPPWRLDAK